MVMAVKAPAKLLTFKNHSNMICRNIGQKDFHIHTGSNRLYSWKSNKVIHLLLFQHNFLYLAGPMHKVKKDTVYFFVSKT